MSPTIEDPSYCPDESFETRDRPGKSTACSNAGCSAHPSAWSMLREACKVVLKAKLSSSLVCSKLYNDTEPPNLTKDDNMTRSKPSTNGTDNLENTQVSLPLLAQSKYSASQAKNLGPAWHVLVGDAA